MKASNVKRITMYIKLCLISLLGVSIGDLFGITQTFLHAPWREHYEGASTNERPTIEGCVFCALGDVNLDGNYILGRFEHCFVMLNKYPYSRGHVLVIPYQHTGKLSDLSCEARTEIFELTVQSADIVCEVLGNCGLNIGVNTGMRAGASIPDHVHMHVVPRYEQDDSFMDVVAQTRVVPWDMGRLYQRLLPYFAQLIKS